MEKIEMTTCDKINIAINIWKRLMYKNLITKDEFERLVSRIYIECEKKV